MLLIISTKSGKWPIWPRIVLFNYIGLYHMTFVLWPLYVLEFWPSVHV